MGINYTNKQFGIIRLFFVVLTFLFTNCIGKQANIDKDKLNGFDFRLYMETPAWELAKAVRDENVKRINSEISKNKALILYKESRFGNTLLHMAVKTMKYKSVQALCTLGANPNIQNTYNGTSPLMEASDIGHGGPMGNFRTDGRFLKLLLKYGGNPNLEEKGERRSGNFNRRTPLLIACKKGVLEYVKILVDAGANINYTNEYRQFPLNSAVFSENPNVVLYLLEHGVDYSRYFRRTIAGKKIYIDEDIQMWRFNVGSENYKVQQRIIEFLKMHPKRS
jgi:hypothetical protein